MLGVYGILSVKITRLEFGHYRVCLTNDVDVHNVGICVEENAYNLENKIGSKDFSIDIAYTSYVHVRRSFTSLQF